MKILKLITALFFIPFFLDAQQSKKEISLQEIWASRTFMQESVNGINSMADGIHYSTLEEADKQQIINQYSYQTGKLVKNLLKSSDLIPEGATGPLNIEEYSFNSDESKVLITTESEPIYRHSTKANFFIYDLKSKKLSKLSDGGKQQYATFSPASNMVAFVRENNIFIKNLDTGKEIQVTNDGSQNEVINGATDWVYEEEFTFDRAFAWSPDGLKIAFYKFNESEVKEFSMAMYGSLYPNEYRYKYPKAGEKNSIVSIHVYYVSKGDIKGVDIGNETDQYIPRIQWAGNSNILSVQRLNRLQNKMEILHCGTDVKPMGGITSKVIYTESSSTYIDGSEDKAFYLKDNKHFIWLSDKDGFNHIYLFGHDGKEVRQITKGNWDVTEYMGIDEKNGLVYFQSAETSPMERNIYSIKTDGSVKKNLSKRKGWNKADFSAGFKYFINEQTDANTPLYVSLHSSDGKEIRILKDNAALKKTLSSYNLSKKEFFSFSTSEKVQLNGWMIKPPAFDPAKKYPVFMFVYGGPGSQTVKDAYEGPNYLWHQLLAQKGYIVVSVDNRGTGARGKEFKNVTYMQLGKFETIDLIETAKHLGELNYVDAGRIGIQGWSYGGYMSSLCLTKGAEQFKMAIAVAPVTNWRFYDTIYTERYMRTPQENPEGYDDNSPINHVAKMKGKYLIVHGTADDNVHFQNMVEMVNSLVKSNKQFEQAIYPDRNHGIYGGITRLHLFSKMTDFIIQNL